MKTLTSEQMRSLDGTWIELEEGAVCGFMVGAVVGAITRGWLVPAAYIFMFTPLACALDYGLR